jgi:hypothetical protein
MTETSAPGQEQIEAAEYSELQAMAKAAGIRANARAEELRSDLLHHHGHFEPVDEPQDGSDSQQAPEDPEAATDPETSPEGPTDAAAEPAVELDPDEPVTWRAVSATMTRDGKRTIAAGETFVAPRSDPRTRDAIELKPEGLTDEQLAALATPS